MKDGKYEGIPGAGDHQLLQMAAAAGDVTLNQQERSVVTRLTDFVLYAGRYPIPVLVENMKPIKAQRGQTVARAYVSRDELETAKALVDRLMREAEPQT